MFQFIRRVSGSFLPRPDRPWRDDATSHAPTIGRKRKHSVTERDEGGSASSSAKRTKKDPAEPDNDRDSASGGGSPKQDVPPPPEGQGVKEVTKGVKEVDLEDEDKPEDTPSIRPEGVPLPDSPSGSPEPQPESRELEPEPQPAKPDETETKEEGHADDKDSVASSMPQDDPAKEVEAELVTINTDALANEMPPAQQIAIAVQSGLHDTPGTVTAKA